LLEATDGCSKQLMVARSNHWLQLNSLQTSREWVAPAHALTILRCSKRVVPIDGDLRHSLIKERLEAFSTRSRPAYERERRSTRELIRPRLLFPDTRPSSSRRKSSPSRMPSLTRIDGRPRATLERERLAAPKTGFEQERPRRDDAFRALVVGLRPQVLQTLQQLGIEGADLEDVAQEVLFFVYQSLEHFEERPPSRRWVHRVCLHLSSEYRKRRSERRERTCPDPGRNAAASESVWPIALIERRARAETMLRAVRHPNRRVLVLHEVEGLTMKRIAEVLACPLQTVYSRLHTGREQLLRAVERREARERR